MLSKNRKFRQLLVQLSLLIGGLGCLFTFVNLTGATPVITVSKTSQHLVDVAPSGITPGSAVNIQNSGSFPATGLNFSDVLDAHTTFVPGSIYISPIALNDSYSSPGSVIEMAATSAEAQSTILEDVDIIIGTLPAGKQATVTADGGINILSDDPSVGGSSNPTYDTLATGTIIITKVEIPSTGTSFGFSTNFVGGFNAFGNGGNIVIPNLAAETYTVTENDPATAFALTNLTCDDGASSMPSTTDLATRTATIRLETDETVTCTFTNNATTVYSAPDVGSCGANAPCVTSGIQDAINAVAPGGTVILLGSQSISTPLTIGKSLNLTGDLNSTITTSGSPASIFAVGDEHLTVSGIAIDGGGSAEIFTQTGSGDLLAYANNISNFGSDHSNSGSGSSNLRHNWWGSDAPTGLTNSDGLAFRLGAPGVSFARSSGSSVSLADGIASGNASLAGNGGGTLVIVNHATTVPFGKGIPAETGSNQCANFYDMFVIGGSGNYDVTLPVKAACQGVVSDALFQFDLLGSGAPNSSCPTGTSCWELKSASAGTAGTSITVSVPDSDLLGTPFAAPSSNNNSPSAIGLADWGISAETLPTIAFITLFTLLTVATAAALKRQR